MRKLSHKGKNEARNDSAPVPTTPNVEDVLKISFENLDLITNNDLDQLSRLENPHALIGLAVEAVGVILDVKPISSGYWGPMNCFLCDPDFIMQLKSVDVNQLDKRIVAKVAKVYKSNENFKPEKVASISMIAGYLCRWVLDVIDAFKVVLSQMDADGLLRALKKGKKEWGRSKIMIVGEGRAGKTAFSNSLIGKPFEETTSTLGINELTCDVKQAAIDGDSGHWDVFKAPLKEFETALAKMMFNEKNVKSTPISTITNEIESGVAVSNAPSKYVSSNPDRPRNKSDNVTPLVDSSSSSETITTITTGHSQSNETIILKPSIKSREIEDGVSTRNRKDVTSQSQQVVIQKPPKKRDIDNDFVMKTLANKVITESKFILSVYDFGGQEVFNVIHPFFLTRYGIYIVVFNMEWLVSPDKKVVDDCMAYLTFWVNSIVVHTTHKSSNGRACTAPVAFVGTHMDKVPSPADHEKISITIFEAFSSNIAFANCIQYDTAKDANGTATFNFFPVNNKLSRSDPGILSLMKSIEKKLDELDYMHEEKDLSWFQVLDSINETKKSVLTVKEVQTIAQSYNVPMVDVSVMLSFFHQVGVLMWHDEERLKDVVIIDPIKYFVTPATLIICKHVPTKDDKTLHSLDIHRKCKRIYQSDWIFMIQKGIVSEELMRGLLEEYKEHYNKILELMMKYSLAIYLPGDTSKKGIIAKNRYVIPALLPKVDNINNEEALDITFYFMFTAYDVISDSNNELLYSDLKTEGFLPSGLFERLIGRTLAWSQETYSFSDTFPLNKNQVTLCFGSQKFRLTEMRDVNCIRVEVKGSSPKLVHDRLTYFLESIKSECMESLCFSTLLPYIIEGESSIVLTESSLFVRLEVVLAIEKNRTALTMNRGGRNVLLDQKVAKERYEPWMVKEQLLEKYDVFISYRWGHPDDEFVGKLFDRLSLLPVERDDHRAIDTFLDKKRLRDGDQFQREFCNALVKSSIVIPIISPHSLEKLVAHDLSIVDNMLVEWICVLYCSNHLNSITILPIAFGGIITTSADGTTATSSNTTATTATSSTTAATSSTTAATSITTAASTAVGITTTLFKHLTMQQLPEVRPEASIALAIELLRKVGIECEYEAVMTYTVKSIVNDLLKSLGVLTWEIAGSDSVVDVSATRIHSSVENLVEKALDDAEKRRGRTTDLPGRKGATAVTINGSPGTTPSDPSAMSLAELTAKIKSELNLNETNHSDIIRVAADQLGVTEKCSKIKGFKEKAILILEEI